MLKTYRHPLSKTCWLVRRCSSAATTTPPKVVSSVPAGTVLKGLNFVKNQADPVAREDHEYPAWLWTVLEPREGKGEGVGAGAAGAEGDLFCEFSPPRHPFAC